MSNLNENQFSEEKIGWDEHFPEPSRPGRVTFAGRELPAATLHRSAHSIGFTTPLENGGIAKVSYFPRQQQANVAMYHVRPREKDITATVAGAYKAGDIESGIAPDWEDRIKAMHGGHKHDMPLDPEQAITELRHFSTVKLPDDMVKDHQKSLPMLSEQWGWNP